MSRTDLNGNPVPTVLLEENILAEGCQEHLALWNETIIDGHNRWAIIQKHPEIPYTTVSMDFPDRYAAIVWICQNQLGRRSITEEQRAVLIAQEYDAQKKMDGGTGANQYTKKQLGENSQPAKTTTRSVVAKAHGITESSVKSAVEFSHGLDSADEVAPGFRDSILTGTVKAPKSVIASLPKMQKNKVTETVTLFLGKISLWRMVVKMATKQIQNLQRLAPLSFGWGRGF